MKEKIREQLQSKYAGAWKKLTPKAQELLLDKLSARVTTDEELENAISGLETSPIPFADYVELIQSEADRRVSEAVAKAKTTQAEPGQQTQQQTPPKQTDDTPEWAKALIQEVNSLKAEKKQSTIQLQLKEKLKGVPEAFYKRAALPESEEELEAFATGIREDYTAFEQERVNASAGDGKVPQGSGQQSKEASKEETDAIVDNIM